MRSSCDDGSHSSARGLRFLPFRATAVMLLVFISVFRLQAMGEGRHADSGYGPASDSEILKDAAEAVSLAEAHERDFIFSEAIRLRLVADSLYSLLPPDSLYADNRLCLSGLYYRTGKYDLAFRQVMDVMPVYADLGDDKALLKCENILGSVFYAVRDYEKASDYFRKFARGAEQSGDTTLMIYALQNLAVYANSMGDFRRSQSFMSESISLCRQVGDSSFLCRMYESLSATYINETRFEEAEECLSLAKPLLGTIEQKGQYHHYLGVLRFFADGNSSVAVEHLDSALVYYGQGEFFRQEQSCLEMLQAIYASDGDYVRAYETLRRYHDNLAYSRERDVVRELFLAQNEILDNIRKEEMSTRRHRQTLILVLFFSAIAIAGAVALVLLKKKTYRIRMREAELANQELLNAKRAQELAAENEIAKLKKLQRFKTDRLVEEMIGRLSGFREEIADPEMRAELSSICTQFRSLKDEDEWREVRQFVPDQDTTFYNNLISAFPNLTVNERRLCVFLNKNLTTKEISAITRQSVHSINIARGRLRSKLGITGDNVSIQEFLSKFN